VETAGRTTLAANIVSGYAHQVWSALSRELLLCAPDVSVVRLPGSRDNGGSRCCLVPSVGLHILSVSKTQGNVFVLVSCFFLDSCHPPNRQHKRY
jgi:hypothetical protein